MIECVACIPQRLWRVLLIMIPVIVFTTDIAAILIWSLPKAFITIGALFTGAAMLTSIILLPCHPEEQHWNHSRWSWYRQSINGDVSNYTPVSDPIWV